MAPQALIITPGATVMPLAYRRLQQELAHSLPSLPTYVIPLPSVGKRPLPAPTLYDDAAAIAAETRKLVDQGAEVTVLAHSYGGAVTTQAIKGLTKAERQKEGKQGGVVRMVWIAALVLRHGQSVRDVLHVPGEVAAREAGEAYILSDAVAMAPFCFNDVEEHVGIEYAQFMDDEAVGTQSDRLTWEGYRTVRHTYVLCLRDLVVPPELQRAFVKTLQEATADMGQDWVDVVELDAGHCPTQTRVEEIVKIVADSGPSQAR